MRLSTIIDEALSFFYSSYNTSEQHKDATKARQQRDYSDFLDILEYLLQRNPFSKEEKLRCIATGVNAEKSVNVDRCKEVVQKVIKSLPKKNAYEYSFLKKDEAVTLATKTAVRLKEGKVQVDPQLLFQRLTFVATFGQYDNP